MNTIQDLFAAWPLAWLFIETLCILIPLASFLAYSGLALVSVLAKILSHSRQRASFDKCALQLAQFGMVLGWGLLVGTRIWLFLTRTGIDKTESVALMMEICWFLLAFSVLGISLYYMLWKHATKHPLLGVSLGLSSWLSACCALLTALTTARFCVLEPHLATLTLNADLQETAVKIFNAVVMSENSMPFLNILWYTLPLIVIFSAGSGALWLFARRRQENFGRDHYNAMIAWCARLSSNAWILLWCLLTIFSVFQIRLALAENMDDIWIKTGTEIAYSLYWAIPGLLWIFVARNAVPLRHLITLLAALLLAGTFLLPYYLELCAI
jgi:hypothetical protein